MRGSWKIAEVWHCQRSEIVIGKVAASVVVEGPGLKRSCREAWNHEESFGEVIGETATKSYVARDLSIWRCRYHGMNIEFLTWSYYKRCCSCS